MKYAYITVITNKHFGKIKKHFRPTLQYMNDLYDTRLHVCDYNTVYCHTNHSSIC